MYVYRAKVGIRTGFYVGVRAILLARITVVTSVCGASYRIPLTKAIVSMYD